MNILSYLILSYLDYPDELSYLSMLSNDFNGFGLSPMPVGEKLLSGRPYGGVYGRPLVS